MVRLKTLLSACVCFSSLNALAMAPLSPRLAKALDLSRLIAQETSPREYTPRLAPLIIKVTNKDLFQITLKVEYAQSHRCVGLPPFYPYLFYKIKGFKTRIIEIARQQEKGRLKQLSSITLLHNGVDDFTLAEQECATMREIQVILMNNRYEKTALE